MRCIDYINVQIAVIANNVSDFVSCTCSPIASIDSELLSDINVPVCVEGKNLVPAIIIGVIEFWVSDWRRNRRFDATINLLL